MCIILIVISVQRCSALIRYSGTLGLIHMYRQRLCIPFFLNSPDGSYFHDGASRNYDNQQNIAGYWLTTLVIFLDSRCNDNFRFRFRVRFHKHNWFWSVINNISKRIDVAAMKPTDCENLLVGSVLRSSMGWPSKSLSLSIHGIPQR